MPRNSNWEIADVKGCVLNSYVTYRYGILFYPWLVEASLLLWRSTGVGGCCHSQVGITNWPIQVAQLTLIWSSCAATLLSSQTSLFAVRKVKVILSPSF